MSLEIRRADADDAEVVHALTRAAFEGQDSLTPPSGAVSETVDVVRDQLSLREGAIAYVHGEPAGCLRLVDQDSGLHVRRVAVHPAYQGRGVCSALVRFAEDVARGEGRGELRLGVRDELPDNLALFEHLGYVVVADHEFWIELAKPLTPAP